MAGVLQHLRSSTLDKRPNPASMVDGQVAINYASGSPGMFFKDNDGNLVKVGPVHVGSAAPNASPASGGTAGNSVGEQWLDTSGGTYVFKVWDGSDWRSEAGEFVNVTGDTMTGPLTIGSGATIIFEGATDDGFETVLTVVDPTADRTITLPNISGTVVTTGDTGSVTSTMIANGTIVDADVNASAAIAGTKISPNFGSQNIVTTGNLTVDTNTLFVDAANNQVGAGTTSPTDRLHLYGSGQTTANITDAGTRDCFLRVSQSGSAAGTGGGILFATQQGDAANSVGFAAIKGLLTNGSDNTTGDLAFSTRRNTTDTSLEESLRVKADGSVGVGTSAPSAQFHTVGSTSAPSLTFDSSAVSTFEAGTIQLGLGVSSSSPFPCYLQARDNTNAAKNLILNPLGGDVTVGKTAFNSVATEGVELFSSGRIYATSSATFPLLLNRLTNDGSLVAFYQDSVLEGSISVSGTTVSYNGAHLSRWSQLPSGVQRTEILRGTVLSNIDEMCEWGDEENEQLNRMKVSDVEGDKNVSGVFQGWDDDDDTYTEDFYCAMTGDFIIRIAAGVIIERGDLLMSAGDGTAKPQDDDIIRSKTIAKVTSTNVSCTYDDGSYCVPCVLMAC